MNAFDPIRHQIEQLCARSTPAPHARLMGAITDKTASPRDLCVLLRGVLRYESLSRGADFEFELPKEFADSLTPFCARSGLLMTQGTTRVHAKSWRPAWLGSSQFDVDTTHLPSERPRSETEKVSGDPILGRVGLTTYTSAAQRDAVRAVLTASAGDTLVLGLPTGAGKTLCAFLPALTPLGSGNRVLGVTVIVVPTVALALHLEKRLSPYVPHSTAYRPDVAENAKLMRERCEAGVQGPIIVSPEALTGTGLRLALTSAARSGWVRYFVIDEAHMVLSWGDEFRPAFLTLASLRREIGQACPSGSPITILLSGTLTDYHLYWLGELFSENDRYRIISGARLRPEPDYWLAMANREEDRRAWVEEALFNLPRPAILYCTLRETARFWFKRLQTLGFHRFGYMDGESTEAQRAQTLEAWDANALDIVVATSAFGLGVDKQDVRSVIHAELPESVDRFYQDVGRSGRDGKASTSILIGAKDDWTKVRGLAQPKFISPELGLERWRRMYNSRRPLAEAADVFILNLDVGRELDMEGDYNRNWNIRAVQLLARVGALEFVPHEDRTFSEVAVRFRGKPHLDREFWENEVNRLRSEISDDYAAKWNLLKELFRSNSDQCISKVFGECYSSSRFGLAPVYACGGCPNCRGRNRAAWAGKIRPSHVPSRPFPARPLGKEARRLFPDDNPALVHYLEIEPNDAHDLLWWCAAEGFINFVVPFERKASLAHLCLDSPYLIVFSLERPPRQLDLNGHQPTVIWLESSAGIPLPDENTERRTLFIAPSKLRCADRPDRLLKDVFLGRALSYRAWANEFLA